MIDLTSLLVAIQSINHFVSNEPQLLQMSKGTRAIVCQAEALVAGKRNLEDLDRRWTCAIEERETAVRLIELMGMIPQLDGTEEPLLRSAVAQLLANLAVIVTTQIYRAYPDVVPRRDGPRPPAAP